MLKRDSSPFLQSQSKYGEICTMNWLLCYLCSKLTCYVILMANSTGPHEWLLHTSTHQKPFATHTSTFASVSKSNSVSVSSIMCFLKEKTLWASDWKHLGAWAAHRPFYTLTAAPPAHTEMLRDTGNSPQTRTCSVFQEPRASKPALLLAGILGSATAKNQAVPWVPTEHTRSKPCH